mmetsp:Transcript_54134/g.60525  ORF Transcript_54134/g.60525 Transcript_54134/m.60525 type:complete len:439 (+) Transcript_54134:226-1542(+)
MGQCSTLPSEGRQSRRGGEDNSSHRGMDQRSRKSSSLQVQTQNGSRSEAPAGFSPIQQQQVRSPDEGMVNYPEPMDMREDIPLPPDIATRTRCYRLHLDSNLYPHHSVFLGPYSDVPPPLTYSCSTDSTASSTPLQVAINTAKIFRGITVGKDGTILSQNARATRSSRGSSKNKRGEKSRQATKIDKAKDLVEQTILTGKAPDSDEPANMQSIIIMGEYDDMKYLVRDGAKKLREASDLPDDSLLHINRGRDENSNNNIMAREVSSPRKRGSMSGQRNSGMHTSNKSRQFSPSGAPPKLKSHPRDRLGSTRKEPTSSRRESHDNPDRASNGSSGRQNEGDWGNTLPVSFSRGFQNIWNCGATGERSDDRTNSPTQQVSSPQDGKSSQPNSTPNSGSGYSHNNSHPKAVAQQQHKTVLEGRDSQQHGQTRESGVTARVI